MSRYKLKEVKDDRWAIWYLDFGTTKRNKLGCYKIFDLYSSCRKYKFAFRYKPREGQTQVQSDNAIIDRTIFNFNKPRNTFFR
jgi:hypothetical protein